MGDVACSGVREGAYAQHTGTLRKSWARRCTSLGHVADHMSVWRSGRIWDTMDRIWGSNPMSSIRSASSSTRYLGRRRGGTGQGIDVQGRHGGGGGGGEGTGVGGGACWGGGKS